jgi:hypothetical protein
MPVGGRVLSLGLLGRIPTTVSKEALQGPVFTTLSTEDGEALQGWSPEGIKGEARDPLTTSQSICSLKGDSRKTHLIQPPIKW